MEVERFYSQFSKEVETLVPQVAEKRQVDIARPVLVFLSDLFTESFVYRREEWGQRLAVDEDERVFRVATVTAERLLMEAKPYKTPNTPRGRSLLIIGIVDQIRKWWCSWPLCT